MELIRGLINVRPTPCVATIGNFDGMHQGHRAVIDQLVVEGQRRGVPVTLVTFEPYPREFFTPQAVPPRLTRLREKLDVLQDAGVDRLLCLRFDRALAHLSAEDFIEQVLVAGLDVRALAVGDDFRFGRGRTGDVAMLRTAGRRHGFKVLRQETCDLEGRRVSSTWVREALAAGKLDLAARLLGRPYTMSGRVAHGDARGRQLGFPTANIHLKRRLSPVAGVYAVRMHGAQATPCLGVANVGTRPTVGGTRALLEVHLLDFDGDLYGRHMRVEFVQHVREERRFESLDALCAQIRLDVVQARAVFDAGR